jgi:hypothetical protein
MAEARTIKRRSTGSEIVMTAPMESLIKRLSQRGFCTTEGSPTTKKGWMHLDADQIVSLYSSINRGIQNYYRFADNFPHLTRIQYILKYSLAKTLAAKFKLSVKQVFSRFGSPFTIPVKAEDGKRDRQVVFYLNSDWEKKRNAFTTSEEALDLLGGATRMRTRSKLGKACCICASLVEVEMHHVRHIRKMGAKKATGFQAIMQALNRKQIPVCTSCHRKIHRGEYDGMRLSDLAYNPYASEKRRRFPKSRMR